MICFSRPHSGGGSSNHRLLERERVVRTAIFSHSGCLAHEMGPSHPECPERLRAIERGLENERFQSLDRIANAPPASPEALLRVHPEYYLDALESAAPAEGYMPIGSDTVMNPQTLEAIWRAAGAAVAAVDDVMRGVINNAFVVLNDNLGTVDYKTGKVVINNLKVSNYNNYISIYMIPKNKDVIVSLNKIAIIDLNDVTVNVTPTKKQ